MMMHHSELVLNYSFNNDNRKKELEPILTYPDNYLTNYQVRKSCEDNCDFNRKSRIVKDFKTKYDNMKEELILLENNINELIKNKEENNNIRIYIDNLIIQKNMINQNMNVLERIIFNIKY